MRSLGLKIFQIWACASGLLVVGAAASLIAYLVIRGWPVINRSLLFGEVPILAALLLKRPVFDGLFPAMAGTVALVVLSVGMAVPVGVAAGIHLAEYSRGRYRSLLTLFFDILAGMPSIVVGLFGFSITVFLHHQFGGRIYPCLLISAISLAILVLPYLIRTTQTALEELPAGLRMIGPALGASRLQSILYILIPRALPGILSGILLAIGRCAEDTAVIMLTGVVATAGFPRSLFANFEALPYYIYYIAAQYADAGELMRGYGAAIILLLLCVILFGLALLIQHRLARWVFSRI